MRVLRFEMTRAFRNKWLAVSIALGTLIGLADIWLNVSQYGFNRGRALIQTWIGTDYQFAYNSLRVFHMRGRVIRIKKPDMKAVYVLRRPA